MAERLDVVVVRIGWIGKTMAVMTIGAPHADS